MPAPDDVRRELADILATVLGCEADDVQPDANLKELGVDSITIVEVGEELGRRFDLYLSDEAIDGLVTVEDAVNAVVRHDGATADSGSPAVPAALTFAPAATAKTSTVPMFEPGPASRPLDPERKRVAGKFATWMVIVGAALGGLVGLGSAAVIGATGLGAANLPPLSVSTTPAPSTTAPTTPAPEPTSDAPSREPTFTVSSTRVSPGERFRLEGAFPALGAGATLKVQVKDPGGSWDDFPVETKTKDGGKFVTEIYTSRTGKREFRMYHDKSSKASPSAAVEIG